MELEGVGKRKTQLEERGKPEYSNHVVRIRGYQTEGQGTGKEIKYRKRVRLHLRRGHARTQRYGQGRKKTKQIWIEPTLVGYEEEGKITQTYEVQG